MYSSCHSFSLALGSAFDHDACVTVSYVVLCIAEGEVLALVGEAEVFEERVQMLAKVFLGKGS